MNKLYKVFLPMARLSTVFIFLLFSSPSVLSQTIFQGSFLMSFKSSHESVKDFPLLWNIQPVSNGGRMVMEIEDDMRQKGVSKRVLFNPVDSTWVMMMEIGNVKQGTRIHRAAMYRDSTKEEKIKTVSTGLKRTINGYRCKKIIRETNNYYTELWITDQVDFNICRIYKLVSHCGMMSESIRKGDWFNWKNAKGMILEITSKNKLSGDTYTISISELKLNDVNTKFFNMAGFKLSDIPEGQNCGPIVEEK